MPWSKPYSLCRGLRHYRCMSRSDLVVWVDKKLRSDWSPEQIAGCPRLDYPEDAGMRISERPSTVGFMQPHSLAIPTIAIYAAPQTPEAARPGRRPVPRRIDIARRSQPVVGRFRFGAWRRIWSAPPGARRPIGRIDGLATAQATRLPLKC